MFYLTMHSTHFIYGYMASVNNFIYGYMESVNKTRQYNIQMFDKIIFSKYRIRQIKVTETNK